MSGTKPIGYLIVIPKEARDAIIAWFKGKTLMDRFEMELPEVGKVFMNYPPNGFPIDLRYRTEEEARQFTANAKLFGASRADLGDRLLKCETQAVSDGTLAKINPEWLNAPWSVEMVFVEQEERPLEKFLAKDTEYEGKVVWVNRENP